MCAIVDANVAGEVFGENKPPAGKEFYNWLNTGRGQLVVGGKLLVELNKTTARDWMRQAILSGRTRQEDASQIVERTAELHDNRRCKSDDPHVIALAQISGARLLYSNDVDLQSDFKSKILVDDPRGKVYSTRMHGDFKRSHRNLLNMPGLCRMQ